MDFEHDDNLSQSSGPGPSEQIHGLDISGPVMTKPDKISGWRIFWGVILVLSVIANIVLVLMLISIIAIFAVGQGATFAEEIIQYGPRSNKIAVVTLEGIIHTEQTQYVCSQLKAARQDRRVKGLILRINSPGGTISGSDQIYNEILKYRRQEGKPVVAFMQGVAASGAYYTSVACDKIIAEPTTITGSIGVMFGHFVLQELLEEKLGIKPVIITSGPKKDWPSSFEQVTEEQRQYVQDKLIEPAYDRFVEIVADGRATLSLADVKELADGSIYGAEEAQNVKLIDEIGYLDEAIELVKSLAGIEEAQVVEYRRPFTWVDFLSYRSQSILKIDRNTLYELRTPQILYLWSVY